MLRALAAGVGALATGSVSLATHARQADAPIATTTAGRIRGLSDRDLKIFKGVRYGADTAARRFQPPLPPSPWTGVRDAFEFGAVAPQTGLRDRRQSEDCLHLNVWTPGLRDRGRRPVLVWFHPGGYSGGTSNELEADGARLSRRGDVVVVTVNHRLNVFGHLYLGEIAGEAFADSGNAGILDLVLALQWVRDNIEEFGGDPGNVTIFGQSGGGAKCATLMAMPAAAGLFHRVLTMSGQQITASRVTTATRHADQLLAALQLPRDRVGVLQSLPMEQLVAASRAPAYLGPVKDGRSLPRDPFDPDAPPLSAGIPMILGNTAGETRTLIGRGDPSIFELTWETLPSKLESHSPFMGTLERREVDRAVPAVASRVLACRRLLRLDHGVAIVARPGHRSGASRRPAGRRVPHLGVPVRLADADRRRPMGRASRAGRAVHLRQRVARAREGRNGRRCGAAGGADERDVPGVRANRPSRHARAPGLAGLRSSPAGRRWSSTALPRVVDDPRGDERRLFAQVPYVQPGT